MAPLQWGPGTEGAHVEPYMQFATRHAARKLVDLGMLPFDGDARRGAEARLAAHLVKILVNVETKAALCAGPQVLAAERLRRATPLLLQDTLAAMSQSAMQQLDDRDAARQITKPLKKFLFSRRMKHTCADKQGLLRRVRDDVRARWENMLQLKQDCGPAWDRLSAAAPAYTSAVRRASRRSWKRLLLAAIRMGGAVALASGALVAREALRGRADSKERPPGSAVVGNLGAAASNVGDALAAASKVGDAVASKVGDALAAASKVGDAAASKVGAAVASKVGDAAASKVGAAVASKVGAAVASKVGAAGASKVGAAAASKVGDAAASKVGAAAASKVGAAVASKVGDAGASKVRPQKALSFLRRNARELAAASSVAVLLQLLASGDGAPPPPPDVEIELAKVSDSASRRKHSTVSDGVSHLRPPQPYPPDLDLASRDARRRRDTEPWSKTMPNQRMHKRKPFTRRSAAKGAARGNARVFW